MEYFDLITDDYDIYANIPIPIQEGGVNKIKTQNILLKRTEPTLDEFLKAQNAINIAIAGDYDDTEKLKRLRVVFFSLFNGDNSWLTMDMVNGMLDSDFIDAFQQVTDNMNKKKDFWISWLEAQSKEMRKNGGD